jgi:hypothetical protein
MDGTSAALATRYSLESTRTPNASGNRSNPLMSAAIRRTRTALPTDAIAMDARLA